MSAFLRLNYQDAVRGIVVAVFAAVITYFYPLVNSADFSFTAVDWQEIVKVAVCAAVAYLGKNFLSTSDGKVLGKIG